MTSPYRTGQWQSQFGIQLIENMSNKSLSWKEAQELEKKLADEFAALEQKQAEDRKRIEEAKRVSAGEALEDALKTITEIAHYLTDAQKAQVSNLFAPAKKPRAAKGTVPKKDKTPNNVLADGKKTPFYYGGKGRKPDILREFEESDAGKKLIEAGKPTYNAIK